MDLPIFSFFDPSSYFAKLMCEFHASQPGGGCQLLWHRLGTKVAGRSGWELHRKPDFPMKYAVVL